MKDQIWNWLLLHGREAVDAFLGSMVYVLYGMWSRPADHKYTKQERRRVGSAFIVGSLVAMYVSPQVIALLPWINASFANFFFGLMGMKLTEFALSIDLKETFGKWLWDKRGA